MIRIHHLNNSRSQRILWLLEELNLEYEIISYERDKETMLAPDSLKKIHPLGKSPILDDEGTIVAESGVIVEYLLKKYGSAPLEYPSDLDEAIKHSYWIHFSEGSLMPPLLLKLVFDKVKNAPVPFFIKPISKKIADKVLESFVLPNINRNMDFIENHLSDKSFFTGEEISGADIMMSFPLEAGMTRVESKSKYPNIISFLSKIHARAPYKLALKRGGEYSYS